jgi:hypothetical protein
MDGGEGIKGRQIDQFINKILIQLSAGSDKGLQQREFD